MMATLTSTLYLIENYNVITSSTNLLPPQFTQSEHTSTKC